MNEQHSESRDFRPDYAILELKDRADWQTVRTNYRRLVHLWHPDRYAQRPRERAHAQQNFIVLTKSYTRLRSFYRRYGRMPFEPTGNRSTNKIMDIRTSNKTRQTAPEHNYSSIAPDVNTPDNEPAIEQGVLSRDRSGRGRAPAVEPRSKTRIIWALASCAIIFATLSVFFLLDRKANQAVIERGREAVRDAPASEFMPSTAEIRRSEAKGAFVQPTK